MKQISLNAQTRESTGKEASRRLRDSDIIPAVVYKRGEKTTHLQVGSKDLIHILHGAAGENAIINLNIEHTGKAAAKKKQPKTVLIKEIQYHPIKDQILHVDFQEISLTEKIEVHIPIVLRGEAVGVKVDGGVLDQVTKELRIECLPTEIPEKFELRVEEMKIGDVAHVKELNIPAGIKVLTDPEQAVVSVSPPVAEAAPAAEEAIEGEAEEPEVIAEKKAEERAAAAEAEKAEEGKVAKPEKQEKKEK